MTEKFLKSRIVHKHDTEADWKKSSLVPLQGEIVVYDKDETYDYERIKVGDGVTSVNALPFADEATKEKIEEDIRSHNSAEDAHSDMGWLTSGDEVADSPAPFDADTLNGRNAAYFDNQIAVERARINQFVALEDGSTTGDAELQDIRVGYDGTVYDTAGEAVRGQVGSTISTLNDIYSKSKNLFIPKELGTYPNSVTDGVVEWRTHANYITSELIPVKSKEMYIVSIDGQPVSAIKILYFMSDGVTPIALHNRGTNQIEIHQGQNIAYMQLSVSCSSAATEDTKVQCELGTEITEYMKANTAIIKVPINGEQIIDGSITSDKMTDEIKETLIDLNDIYVKSRNVFVFKELGTYPNSVTDGVVEWKTHANYITSELIPVADNEKYIVSVDGVAPSVTKVLYYLSDSVTPVLVNSGTSNLITVPTNRNIAYMQLSVSCSSAATEDTKVQCELGTEITEYMKANSMNIASFVGIKSTIDGGQIIDNSITHNKIEDISFSGNLFNPYDEDVVIWDIPASVSEDGIVTWTEKVPAGTNNVYITSGFIPVEQNTKYYLSVCGQAPSSFKLLRCDENKKAISLGSYGSSNKGRIDSQTSRYIRVSLPYADNKGNISVSKNADLKYVPYNEIYAPDLYISKNNIYDEDINKVKSYTMLPEIKHTIDLTISYLDNEVYCSDMVVIENELWVFNSSSDDHSTYGSVAVFDINNGEPQINRFIPHNLGHCNTVSYCSATDMLICGNGSNSYDIDGEIYILHNVKTAEILEYSNADIINLSGYDYGAKANVCWATGTNRHDQIWLITNDNQNIRRIILGKNENQLTNGTYTSVANGHFNGTWKILDEYESGIIGRFGVCNQGSDCHNGSLYVGVGHNGTRIWKFTPLSDGIERSEYIQYKYDASGEIVQSSTEGITFSNKYMIIGTNNSIDFYLI